MLPASSIKTVSFTNRFSIVFFARSVKIRLLFSASTDVRVMGELWLQHRLSSLFSWIQFTVEYRYIEARPWGSLPQDLLYRSVKSRFHCTVEGLSLARFLVTVFSLPPNSFQYYLCTSNANYFNNSAIFTKSMWNPDFKKVQCVSV